MSSDEKQMSLAGHRLDQAEQSLEEARYLMEGGKSLRSVVNRIYYDMFYQSWPSLFMNLIHLQNIRAFFPISTEPL